MFFHFLRTVQHFPMKFCEDVFGITLMDVKTIVFTSCPILLWDTRVFWGLFWHIYLYFLRTVQYFPMKFFADVLGITLSVTIFFVIFSYHDPLCWGAFWNIFGLVLGNCSSYILKFCTDIFRITLTVIIPKFIFLIISKGAGGYFRVFFAHFGVLFLYFLRAVQHFAQNFVQMFLTLL